MELEDNLSEKAKYDYKLVQLALLDDQKAYAELMEETDAELPGLAAEYAPADFSGLPAGGEVDGGNWVGAASANADAGPDADGETDASASPDPDADGDFV